MNINVKTKKMYLSLRLCLAKKQSQDPSVQVTTYNAILIYGLLMLLEPIVTKLLRVALLIMLVLYMCT